MDSFNKKSLYIHIPFCKQKCIYCDFNSYANKENLFENYFIKLKSELSKIIKENNGNKFNTIYIGGGTPSNVPPNYLKDILKMLDISLETTIEVNPGTVDEEKLKIYNEIGINRLSIGLQSYNNKILKEIGRIHNTNDFEKTYNLAKKVGFKNINVDFIIGLPFQNLDDISITLDYIKSINPVHISFYSLILHDEFIYPKSFLDNIPKEEIEREMYHKICKELKKLGYIQYEISNFARQGFESKHNIHYWNQDEYFGIGAGASSYINNIRYKNIDDIQDYIDLDFDKIKIIEEIQDNENKLREYIILKLRLIEGFNIDDINKKFSIDFEENFKNEIKKLINLDLIKKENNNYKLTTKGLDFANIVWEEFI